MKTITLALTILSLSLGACDEFDGPSIVVDLRLLGVRADPPEVDPGATVTLTTLIANPENDPLTFAWFACVLPQLGEENDQEAGNSGGDDGGLSDDPYGGTCRRRVEAGVEYAISLGNGPGAELPIPADLFDDDAALRFGYGFDEDTEIPAAVKELLLSIAGFNYTVELVIESPARRIEVQKRVNVSLADDPDDGSDNPKNENPDAPWVSVVDRATDLPAPVDPAQVDERCFPAATPPLVAGHAYDLTPLDVPRPGPSYQLLVLANTGSIPYQIETREEDSYYAFFATRGRFDDEDVKALNEGAKNIWRLGDDDAGAVDLWIVRRDGRGGIAWCHEPLVIAP